MSNVFYPNFPIPATANVVQVVWKLTRAMKKAGWNVVAHSDGTTKTAAGTNLNDSWGSNVDPSSDVYPASFDTAKAPWIVMSGPVTLQIPLSANPTGILLRGETITQAVSAAEGELLGYVWSIPDGSGWAVVLPRTGTFDNTNIVTGSTSAATFVPTGTIITYAREIMYGKTTANDTINGQIWYTCCDTVGESTKLFSFLATQSGCTAIVPPGSGGTSNGFPTFGNVASPTGGAIAIRGTGGSTTADNWFGSESGYIGNAQIACVNAIPAAGVSADGSFYIAADNGGAIGLGGWAYQRVDDGEPGDVDPYVFLHVTQGQDTTWVRTSNLSSGSTPHALATNSIFGNSFPCAYGYTARGVTVSSSARDIASPYSGTVLRASNGNVALQDNTSTARTWNHPSTSPPIIRESIALYCKAGIASTFHQFKGRLRWMFAMNTGSPNGTADSKTFLCTSSVNGATQPSIYIGPYDGVSTPT